MSSLSDGLAENRPQLMTMYQPKHDASIKSYMPLPSSSRQPLLPRGQMPCKAQIPAPVRGREVGSWLSAVPADSSPQLLLLQAHPVTCFDEEEEVDATSLSITTEHSSGTHNIDNEQPAVIDTVDPEQPAMSSLSDGFAENRPQMMTTHQPKNDALINSFMPLQSRSKLPLLPRGQVSKPGQGPASVGPQELRSWLSAMPVNSTPQQLLLQAHPVTCFDEEEEVEATLHSIITEHSSGTQTIDIEQPAATSAIAHEGPATTHAAPTDGPAARYCPMHFV